MNSCCDDCNNHARDDDDDFTKGERERERKTMMK